MRLGMFMMPVHPPTRAFRTHWPKTKRNRSTPTNSVSTKCGSASTFGHDRTDPLAADVHGEPAAAHQKPLLGTAVVCLPNHHPVKVAAEVAQFDNMSRGRFMLGIGPGGLLSDFELFGNADRGVRARKTMESIAIDPSIWAQDPPYDLPGEFRSVQLKEAIIPGLGIGTMPKPFQKPGPPVTMSVSSPTRRPRASPGSRAGAFCPATICRQRRRHALAEYGKACAEAGRAARSERRVARNIMVAPSDAERRDRVFSAQGSNHYFYTYMREVLSRVGILSVMKPDPNMPDEEATVEVITEGCMLYGSPKTMLDKLVAFRDEVGPFGTLLMTGLDWGGPNEAWERDLMSGSWLKK